MIVYRYEEQSHLSFFTIIVILMCTMHTEAASLPHILVLSETKEWDHQTRTVGDSVILALGRANGFNVTTTDNTDGYFTKAFLSTCDAVCFINTTGTIFTDAEAAAFEQYMYNGGGYVGVHASTDCEYGRTWYANMTGANFNGHPFNIAEAKISVLNKNHPSTNFITTDTLIRTDEWYFWADNPGFQNKPIVDPAENDSITVLMELVESSINGSSLDHFHPICWYKNYGTGRVWYTGFGHDPTTFKDTLMVNMLLGGIRYVAKIQSAATTFKLIPSVYKPVQPEFLNVYDCMGRVVTFSDFKRTHASFPILKNNRIQFTNRMYLTVRR